MIININVFLKSKLDAVATSNIIGKTNESNSTILKFYFKEEPGDNLFFLDIEKPNGEKFKSSELKIEDNVAIFKVSNKLLDAKGILKIEPILCKDDYIKKYPILLFNIEESINATKELTHTHNYIESGIGEATPEDGYEVCKVIIKKCQNDDCDVPEIREVTYHDWINRESYDDTLDQVTCSHCMKQIQIPWNSDDPKYPPASS